MFQIPVFEAEWEVGLAERVRSSASVAYCSRARLSCKQDLPESALAKINQNGLGLALAAENGSFDLHYLKTLLVSTAWNKNDDVFLPEPTWAARGTAVDKPFNFEHTQSDIIGHMTSSYVVDDEGATIADDIAEKDIPDKFHIVTGAVLYKCWADAALQERMDLILEEIAEGKWFVSMECLLRGFDYAVKADDGTCRVIARTDQTAFLTKHLRVYGGNGLYQGQPLGRVLRDFVFSGKGLVKKPANPDSIIFPDEAVASEPVLKAVAHQKLQRAVADYFMRS